MLARLVGLSLLVACPDFRRSQDHGCLMDRVLPVQAGDGVIGPENRVDTHDWACRWT